MSDRTDLIEQIQADEADFEKIRLTLINELAEPARTAFWMAVTGRDRAREAIAALRADGAGVFETCATCDGSGLALNGIGEPDLCPECRGNTVVRSALSQPAQSGPVNEAKEDARLLGAGYLRVNPDESMERLDPASIAFIPVQPAQSAAQSSGAQLAKAFWGIDLVPPAEQPAQSRNDVIEAVTQAAIANMPAEFQGEIGAGDLDRMVRAIIAAHDSAWERRANAMAEHHRQAVAAMKARNDVIEECAKVADAKAAGQRKVIKYAQTDAALSDTGRQNIIAIATAELDMAISLATALRALKDGGRTNV
jgi:hypothetical protein